MCRREPAAENGQMGRFLTLDHTYMLERQGFDVNNMFLIFCKLISVFFISGQQNKIDKVTKSLFYRHHDCLVKFIHGQHIVNSTLGDQVNITAALPLFVLLWQFFVELITYWISSYLSYELFVWFLDVIWIILICKSTHSMDYGQSCLLIYILPIEIAHSI